MHTISVNKGKLIKISFKYNVQLVCLCVQKLNSKFKQVHAHINLF